MYLLIFLVPTVVCVWFQIKYLNVALKIYCDAIFVLPVYQSFWICTGVGSGLIFYQEYRDITGMRIAGFIIGLTIALSGLAVLARRKSRPRAARRLDDKAAHDADPPGAEAVPRSPSLLPRHKGNGNAVGQPLSKEMSSQGCSYVTSCSPPAQPLCYSDVCSTVDIDLGLEDKDKDEPGAHRPADDLRAPLSKASILTDDDDEASEATHLCRTPLSPGINGEDSDHNGTHVRR
ncbi:hypothetical protein DIPPA_07998 [Diplonema papillatum]|nr:hypothetical protein DIPPA_07998 [Diplonema papillatum]